jgi:hypothetical protein
MIHRVANSMRSSTLGLICMFINHLYPQTKGLSWGLSLALIARRCRLS